MIFNCLEKKDIRSDIDPSRPSLYVFICLYYVQPAALLLIGDATGTQKAMESVCDVCAATDVTTTRIFW